MAMRVLHVVDSLDRGGLEHLVCDLASEQLRRGYSVSVYCLHRPGSLAIELEARGVRVLCGFKRHGPDYRVVSELKRLAIGATPAVLHSHSMMPNYYACAARMLAALSFKVVNTRHDMGSVKANDTRERLYRLSVPLTRLVVMVSEGVKDRFIAARIVPARKARVVLNGIHTECPLRSDSVQRAEARSLLHAEPDHFVAGCVGRLVDLKNHSSAIRAVATLAKAFPKLRLVLIGGGPLESSLRELTEALDITDRVQLLGERNDTRKLLPGIDAFLMPSLTEGHSIALLEAAAAGLPIIATAVGGNPEIVSHAQSGWLVPPAHDEALAAALSLLMTDDSLAASLGFRARTWSLENVSVEAMAAAYERVYVEALGKN